ncbi:hypothetical protein C8R46DRAFT_1289596 [Mycena filopes]|nr:hypothetical protein C8R46DRAFT_1289596 [Mycena filopes]
MVPCNVGMAMTFFWVLLTALPALTAAFPSQGHATWVAPAANDVVAECYPLSIQFASPVPPHNISFYYYYGAQTRAAETYVLITSWPQSQWVDGTTLYKVDVPSVPVAAGTMMALNVQNYDSSLSWLHAIVVQPNTDDSCITSVKQQGIGDYNHYPVTPITTTVSPATTAAAPPPSSTSPAPNKDTSPSSTAAKSPTVSSSPSATANAPSAAVAKPSGSPSASPSATLLADVASTAVAAALPTDPALTDASAKSTTNHTPIIAGVIIGVLLLLVFGGAAGIWVMRQRRRQRTAVAEKRVSSALEPYARTRHVPTFRPAPIQEVDGGEFTPEPDRLPPSYDDILHSPTSVTMSAASTTDTNPSPNYEKRARA